MTDEPEVVALALVPRGAKLYYYEGDNTVDFPVRFEGVNVDHPFTVDNPAHKITSQLVGTQYFVAEYDSYEGREAREAVEEIREAESDDEVLEIIDRRLERLEEVESDG